MTSIGDQPTNAVQVIRCANVTSGAYCLKLGDAYLWVDTTGDLRIETSGSYPASDTSGVVVGAQS